ncbi:substrate-binding domain-containing protein (plasmid) [Deinococcus taeanensis]|uniref:substrate-binding domain-containing protein n=1 Tax=Deinococcus taeanensis TaxID=2737050 RepID=UPI001CDC9781|nr:substrate-binding domain-containing protein [Deinococcus taeanensis]UBV44320.1 substrate-binding domain-containing protein [Deinococcus taeanensis]
MKKSISNRDVERIAQHAALPPEQVRKALALKGDVPPDTVERVMASARTLRYTISARDRVAMAADTSVATVNRAYRPDARHLVRPDLLRRIEFEAGRLGYTPDLVAQARRSHGSPIVALCVELDQLLNPYHAQMLFHLMNTFVQRDRHPVITPITSERSLPELAQSGVTSSVVLWEGRHTRNQVTLLTATSRRAVLIGRHEGVPSVAPDWVTASGQLTRRALTRGYDLLHLGYFSPERWLPGARLEGVARVLAEQSGPLPQLRLWTDPNLNHAQAIATLRRRGQHLAADLFAQLSATPGALDVRRARRGAAVTEELMDELNLRIGEQGQRVAVLGLSDMTARLLLHTLETQRPEWTLGERVGLVGYDNIEPLLSYLHPVLTTVAYDMSALCQQVAELTEADHPAGDGPAPFQVVPTTVVDRQSL